MYYGNNERANEIISYAISKIDQPSAELYHSVSVQNTKNGNYSIAIDFLEKAMAINPQEVSRYYGWLLLYYYRDYEKALAVLEQNDAYTPNFADAPMGEDVHYLKGLCYMQMHHYQKAIDEFNTYINNLANTHEEDFVDVHTFVQKGRCLSQLGKFEEAILAYKKAIHYYENCTEAYYFMGLTQLEMNDKTAEERVIDGSSWAEFCDALKAAGQVVQSEKAPKDAFNQAEGYRYLTRLLRAGLESFLQFS